MRTLTHWQDKLDRYIDLTLARRICPGARRSIRCVLREGGSPHSILIAAVRIDDAIGSSTARCVAAYLRYLGGKP